MRARAASGRRTPASGAARTKRQAATTSTRFWTRFPRRVTKRFRPPRNASSRTTASSATTRPSNGLVAVLYGRFDGGLFFISQRPRRLAVLDIHRVTAGEVGSHQIGNENAGLVVVENRERVALLSGHAVEGVVAHDAHALEVRASFHTNGLAHVVAARKTVEI